MKSVIVCVLTFLCLVFVCHFISGNEFPDIDTLMSNIVEECSVDFDGYFELYTFSSDYLDKFKQMTVEYYFPSLSNGTNILEYLRIILMWLERLGPFLVHCISIPIVWAVGALYSLLYLIIEMLGTLRGFIIVLFGIGA